MREAAAAAARPSLFECSNFHTAMCKIEPAARRLARAMGGDVAVDSAPGQGARFTFTLPLRAE